jgi:hypothetical protein
MMDCEDAAPTITESENKTTEIDVAKEVHRKTRLEAHLTSGCGYGRKKLKLVDKFWTIVWSGLEKAGWRKVGQSFRNKWSHVLKIGKQLDRVFIDSINIFREHLYPVQVSSVYIILCLMRGYAFQMLSVRTALRTIAPCSISSTKFM